MHLARRGIQMPKALFEKNGTVVFTMEYATAGFFSKKTYKQGTSGIITRTYGGLLDITHVDIRLKDGTFLREVPVRYLAV